MFPLNSKWHHKFVKHNTTPWYVYQSVFEIFTKFVLLFPHLQLLTDQLSLFPFSVVWAKCGLRLASICVYWFSGSGSLALWTTCSVPALDCLPSGPCVVFRIYLLGSGSLVSLVGGVVWCYFCWDPARFVLLHFVIPFHLFTFYLRPHAMPLVLQLVGDRLVFPQGCYWGRGIIVLVLPVA